MNDNKRKIEKPESMDDIASDYASENSASNTEWVAIKRAYIVGALKAVVTKWDGKS